MSEREAQTESVPISEARTEVLDWPCIVARFDADDYTVIGIVGSPAEYSSLATPSEADERFRSRIMMARHGFGHGQYKYFEACRCSASVGARKNSFSCKGEG